MFPFASSISFALCLLSTSTRKWPLFLHFCQKKTINNKQRKWMWSVVLNVRHTLSAHVTWAFAFAHANELKEKKNGEENAVLDVITAIGNGSRRWHWYANFLCAFSLLLLLLTVNSLGRNHLEKIKHWDNDNWAHRPHLSNFTDDYLHLARWRCRVHSLQYATIKVVSHAIQTHRTHIYIVIGDFRFGEFILDFILLYIFWCAVGNLLHVERKSHQRKSTFV